jgi:transposase-like protein
MRGVVTEIAMPKPSALLCSPRRRWTEDDARDALDAFARSGLSMRAFAEAAGINVQRLARWRRKWVKRSQVRRAKPKMVPFVEVRQREAERVEVVLRSGRVLRCAEEISDGVLRRLVVRARGGARVLSLPPSVRLFVATRPVDGRKGADSLMVIVRDVFRKDPLSGHLFVFFSMRRDRVRIVYWGVAARRGDR